ncbi:MAG: hypothetical protein HY781_00940 [Chloroflexi bacterium]|nr:hypothetical protein [Chloroflexota bacterium]
MKTLTFHDIERLSAFLDGQLRQAEKTRLETRIKSDPELAATLDGLHQARSILRRTPKRRAPRNFTLTPKMAGIRPPVPRAVPVFSWASAVAALFFICTLGTNLLGQFSFGAAAPMMAAQPMGVGGGPSDESLAATEAAVDSGNAYLTATPETYAMTIPEATATPDTRLVQPPETSQEKTRQPVNLWLVFWPGLAAVLVGSALLIRWASIRAFRRKISPRQKP